MILDQVLGTSVVEYVGQSIVILFPLRIDDLVFGQLLDLGNGIAGAISGFVPALKGIASLGGLSIHINRLTIRYGRRLNRSAALGIVGQSTHNLLPLRIDGFVFVHCYFFNSIVREILFQVPALEGVARILRFFKSDFLA